MSDRSASESWTAKGDFEVDVEALRLGAAVAAPNTNKFKRGRATPVRMTGAFHLSLTSLLSWAFGFSSHFYLFVGRSSSGTTIPLHGFSVSASKPL